MAAIPSRTVEQQSTSSLTATDPTLAPFLEPTFSASAYLNAVLPDWSHKSIAATTTSTSQTPIANLTVESQELLTRLNAQLNRLTTTLNQLTDEILRSGGRLSYEVEVLRGDVSNLNDALQSDSDDSLKHEFARLGIKIDGKAASSRFQKNTGETPDQAEVGAVGKALEPHHPTTTATATNTTGSQVYQQAPQQQQQQPEYIKTLHTLAQVRTNLDRVISVFGSAIDWVIPPSELSLRSGIVSVAPPPVINGSSSHPGTAAAAAAGSTDAADLETRGKEYAARLRDEIAGLLDDEDGGAGVEAASRRVQELRELLVVWRGTAEERARSRFVEGLARMVEEVREKREGGNSAVVP